MKKDIEFSYEELLSWFENLPTAKKEIFTEYLNAYHLNLNSFVNYSQMYDFLSFLSTNTSIKLKKNKIKYSKGEITQISLLAKHFYKIKNILFVKQKMKENGETFTCNVSKITKGTKAENILKDGLIYLSYKPYNNKLLLEASNMKDKNSPSWKGFYYDEEKSSVVFINNYSPNPAEIDQENETGILISSHLNSFMKSQNLYAITLTEDAEKLKTLSKILPVKIEEQKYTKN